MIIVSRAAKQSKHVTAGAPLQLRLSEWSELSARLLARSNTRFPNVAAPLTVISMSFVLASLSLTQLISKIVWGSILSPIRYSQQHLAFLAPRPANNARSTLLKDSNIRRASTSRLLIFIITSFCPARFPSTLFTLSHVDTFRLQTQAASVRNVTNI